MFGLVVKIVILFIESIYTVYIYSFLFGLNGNCNLCYGNITIFQMKYIALFLYFVYILFLTFTRAHLVIWAVKLARKQITIEFHLLIFI
jgi:hypothetical protein